MQTIDIHATAQRLARTPSSYRAGLAAGKEWALHHADAVELEALEVWDFGEEIEGLECRGNVKNPARAVAQARFEQDWGYEAVEEIMCGPITEPRLRGFVFGALEVWWAAQPQMNDYLAAENGDAPTAPASPGSK